MLNAQVEHSVSVSEPAWFAYTTACPHPIGLRALAVIAGSHINCAHCSLCELSGCQIKKILLNFFTWLLRNK